MRVDQYLEDGVSEREVDRWVRSASLLHSNGDALDVAVKEAQGFLRDLQDLYLMAHACGISWTRIGQAVPQALLVAS